MKKHLKPPRFSKDLRYYRNIENGNQPTYDQYYRCGCNWKLAQWLNRFALRPFHGEGRRKQ
jgi:hypothetical protein